MLKIIITSFSICFLLSGCKLPSVNYFQTQPYIRAHQVDINKNITIILDKVVRDSVFIKSAGIKKMKVYNFRQTVEDALKNTFITSFSETNISNMTTEKGLSLIIVKIRPDWEKKSAMIFGGGNRNPLRTKFELQAKITYEAIVFSDGERVGVIENSVFSEKTTFKRKETPEVFKDGIKIMCEDLYKQVIKYK